MGWLVNIITSCSLVRSFGNVRGGNKASVMRIEHNNYYECIVTCSSMKERERERLGDKGKGKGQQLNLRNTVSSNSSSIIIFEGGSDF